MGVLIILGVGLVITALVVGAVFIVGPEYDRHPWVRHVLDAFAATSPAAYAATHPDPRADLPKSYTDQIPGDGNDTP